MWCLWRGGGRLIPQAVLAIYRRVYYCRKVMHNDEIVINRYPPMSKQVRVTVSIDSDHLAVYKEMAALAGLSVSRCLGEWLGDTVDSALFVSANMAKARKAPQAALNEMLALSNAAHEDILQLKSDLRAKGRSGGASTGGPRTPLTPPLSNTGVKVPRRGANRG